jgi:hypothetical protein
MTGDHPGGWFAEVWHDGHSWCWRIPTDDGRPIATHRANTRWGAGRQARRALRRRRKADTRRTRPEVIH